MERNTYTFASKISSTGTPWWGMTYITKGSVFRINTSLIIFPAARFDDNGRDTLVLIVKLLYHQESTNCDEKSQPTVVVGINQL